MGKSSKIVRYVYVSAVIGMIFLSGCALDEKSATEQLKPLLVVMEAKYTPTPVTIDGKLDDDIWKKATVYKMNISRDRIGSGKDIKENGEVQLAWDDNYLYLGVLFEDSDILAEGDKDQMHHYQLGDVCELFLKPENQTYYWELYVTPRSKKSSFLYPSKSYLGIPSCLEDYECGLKIAADIQGTLNNWQDKDRSWTGEMAMPIKDLEAFGEKFGPGTAWRIFVSRYNYSRYMDSIEFSMSPVLSITDFHLLAEYAVLTLTD